MKLLSGGQQKLFQGKQWSSQTEWYNACVLTPLTGEAAIAADHYSPTERAADDSFARLEHAAIHQQNGQDALICMPFEHKEA